MARALSVARVTVAPAKQSEYLAAIQQLAELASRRGQHVWVFRSTDRSDTFLEFSESPSALSHRARASRTPDELKIEMKLQSIAKYEPGSWDLWEEIPTEAPRRSEGWTPESDEETDSES